jgi:hypothetical protein
VGRGLIDLVDEAAASEEFQKWLDVQSPVG